MKRYLYCSCSTKKEEPSICYYYIYVPLPTLYCSCSTNKVISIRSIVKRLCSMKKETNSKIVIVDTHCMSISIIMHKRWVMSQAVTAYQVTVYYSYTTLCAYSGICSIYVIVIVILTIVYTVCLL